MKKRALFLDRDGVINVEKNYLYRAEDVEFIDGIFELTKRFYEADYLIVVVTNQSGIARGYYSQEQFEELMKWIGEEFKSRGVELSAIYHCPHHPDFSGECSCRKPEPGMLFRAAKELNIDLKNSTLIGDNERDIEAGLAAGVQRNYLFKESVSSSPSRATAVMESLELIKI